MKSSGICIATLVLGTTFALQGQAEWIPTNEGVGADAEVRESDPVQNRGTSTEIALRILNNWIAGNANDGNDRSSVIYTKFDLTGALNPDAVETAFRMTYRNNNLNGSRIQDTSTPNPDIRTGLAIYGLNNNSIANWDETTITYLNAPGITFDGDVGTVDLNSDLTFLGTVAFPLIGTQNHLPIGGELRFCSADLDVFVKNALDSDYTSVTLVAVLIHSGGAPFGNWLNFNYLFNPKEQATLNGDNYDPDGQGNIGNLTSTDNSTGDFSPALAIFDKANVVTDDLCGTAPMNQPPDCSAAVASDVTLSPANGELVPVNILGITDEDDDPVAVTVDAIFQDEPTSGHGSPSPDGSGIGSDTAYLRAERAAKGNGRVYTILFTADDGNGGQCLGDVTVGVPKGNGAAVDDGPSYDSTLP